MVLETDKRTFVVLGLKTALISIKMQSSTLISS